MWPEPVQRVAQFLRDAHAEARVEEFREGTPTARDAARAVGVKPAQIVKSVVLVCDDGRHVVALVPGDRRVDPTKVAAAAGCATLSVATRDQVLRATGFEAGAVAPFPLPDVDAVFVDSSLFVHDHVWVGAGSPHHLARLRPADLARLARARQMDAVADGAYDSS